MQIDAVQQSLRDLSIDAWLFFDHHERDPLAYRILGFQPPRMVTRRWYYLIPAHGEPLGLVHRIEPNMLDALPGAKITYSSWQSQREALRDLLQGRRRVAMQYSPECAVFYVSLVDAGTVELVRSFGVDVVSSADLIQLFEACWSAAQLESHLEAGRRVDEVRRSAFAEISARLERDEPVTEYGIQRFIRDAFDQAGLFTDHGPIVAVNANAADCHYEPSSERNQPIRRGDQVLIDLWAKLVEPANAVYYDITWTGYAGDKPPSEIENVFAIVTAARDTAIARVQQAKARNEEIAGYQVDDAARSVVREKGFGDYFVHRTGHSIGRDVHGAGANMDNLETHDTRRLIPNTCFSVEPGIYLANFGIRSEVNVYVSENEAFVTGEIQRKLVLI
jgi:Xaa-Pro aminopeptidase